MCTHQWFEVQEIGVWKSEDHKNKYMKERKAREGSTTIGYMDISEYKNYGVRVECANCNEKKDLIYDPNDYEHRKNN